MAITKKTKEEIKVLREGGKILANILEKAAVAAKPGATTGELEEITHSLIVKAGGRPSFKNHIMYCGRGFPSALCTSINHEIVHGPALPSRVLKSGDVLGLDLGMEYPLKRKPGDPINKRSKLGGFYTDMAKTVIVGGEASERVKKLVETTKKSLELAINRVRPGNTLNDIGKAIQQYVESQGFSVVRELVGHGVGYTVHEDPQVPNYEIKDNSLDNVTLEPGMVIAIEPMVNIGGWRVETVDDGFTIVTADGSLSAHFEHTVAITENGHEILTLL